MVRLLILTGIGLALAGPAAAQSFGTNSASFNAGFGGIPGQENRAVSVSSMRDANGNMLILDGIIQTGSGGGSGSGSGVGSASASATSGATASASAGVSGGVGSGSATAIGNSLTVVTQGNYNTVIVSSTQINTGAVSASASTGTTNAQ